jgi:hypothetical protein
MKKITKKNIAKEYIFFLKVVFSVAIMYLGINGGIYLINFSTDSNIKETEVLKLKIDALRNSNQNYFGKAQQDLYSILNSSNRYTKSFSEFQAQFYPMEKRIKLFKAMEKDKLYAGTFNAFNKKYYPSNLASDKKIDEEIKLLDRLIHEKIRDRIGKFSFLAWYWPLFFLAFLFIVRLLLNSYKVAKSILS